MYCLRDNFVFEKNETPFCQHASEKGLFLLLFFQKKMFSSLVQIFVVSSDGRQQSNELHTNQSQLFKVGQAPFR